MRCEHCPHCEDERRYDAARAANLRKYADQLWERGHHADAARVHAQASELEKKSATKEAG